MSDNHCCVKYKEEIESLQMDLETFSSNAMKAMEVKDQEIARLMAELEKANKLIDRMIKELDNYDDSDFSDSEEN